MANSYKKIFLRKKFKLCEHITLRAHRITFHANKLLTLNLKWKHLEIGYKCCFCAICKGRSYYGKRHISQPISRHHNPGLPSWGHVNDSVYIPALANIMITTIVDAGMLQCIDSIPFQYFVYDKWCLCWMWLRFNYTSRLPSLRDGYGTIYVSCFYKPLFQIQFLVISKH